MRLEVHVHGSISFCKGVTRAQVEAALRPWLDYLDVEHIEEAKSIEQEEPGIVFDARNRALDICWSGDVGRSFRDRLEESLNALCPLTGEAAEVSLSIYYDNGEEEGQVIFVGPSPEAIHEAKRRRMVEDISSLISRHFGQEAVEEVSALVNDLFARDWAENAGRSGATKHEFLETAVFPGRKHLH